VLFTERDVVADLAGTDVVVDRAERVERVVPAEGAGAVALDVLVRAHRLLSRSAPAR
jgi:hypothetical protein